MNRRAHRCPKCQRLLARVIERVARERELPKQEVVHAFQDTYVVRRPIGVQVVGECDRCGFVHFFPMSAPSYGEVL